MPQEGQRWAFAGGLQDEGKGGKRGRWWAQERCVAGVMGSILKLSFIKTKLLKYSTTLITYKLLPSSKKKTPKNITTLRTKRNKK